MSLVDSEYAKSYVVTYKELAFVFIVFCVILFALYPKDMLKEQILSEKSNYDLSMLYLKTLLEHDPKNESLMLILAEQSLRTGKKDLSLRLLGLLLESENKEFKNKATLLSYELKKDDYYYFTDELKQAEQREILRKLFRRIYTENMFNEEKIDMWYNEARFLQEEWPMYNLAKKKIEKDPLNIEVLEVAYYLSVKFKKPEESLKFVELLAQYDEVKKDKWLMDEYYLLMNARLFGKAQVLLNANANKSKEWKNKLADFYLQNQEYTQASDTYIELFETTQDYVEKREYFFKAVRTLQAGNNLPKAAALAKKYESYYLRDTEVRKFLLKIYLATGNLDDASALAKKILKRELRK